MKKIIFTFLILLALGWTNMSQAQDCSAIVRPLCILHGYDSITYPQEKMAYWCNFSRNAFFIVEEVPAGAIVNDISELTDLITGNKLSPNFVADLNTISYWAYNYYTFRPKGYEKPIYFRMGDKHSPKYLAVRSESETMDRTNNPEKY